MILWHNPRCSKSRQTLALLQENGVEPDVRLYLKAPPTEEEIRAVQAALELPLRGMIRTGEALYKDLGLADADETGLLAAMATHPILIERPIAITSQGARIGRPPEKVLELL